jgi:hypothetical protein
MRGAVLIGVGALLGAALLASVVPAGAEPGATVFDRTLQCRPLLTGGIHEVELRAHSGVRASPNVWRKLPFAMVTNGNVNYEDAFAWITAGRPSASTLLGESYFQSHVRDHGTLGIRLGAGCRATRAKVAFSTKGLAGGQASQLGEVYDCETPREVLVRVRATLESGSLRARAGFLRAATPLADAAFMVRTPSGRPIAYASVASSGTTRLFTATGCSKERIG